MRAMAGGVAAVAGRVAAAAGGVAAMDDEMAAMQIQKPDCEHQMELVCCYELAEEACEAAYVV